MAEYKKLMKNNTAVDVFEDELDIPSYGKKVNEYRDIVLDTIKQIEMINTKQLKSAGTVYTQEGGQMIKVELEDTKKIYRQLIDFLEDLMLRYFDDVVGKKLKVIEEELGKKYKVLLDLYIKTEPKRIAREHAKINKMFPINNPNTRPFEEKYEDYKQESYRKRFRELMLLFARKRDLSGKRIASVY